MPPTRWYQSLLPGAKLAIIPGAGHLTAQDNPVGNIRAIRAFVHDVEAGRH